MSDPTKQLDDLDAVRAVVEAVKSFQSDDQRRILRWAQEKLGLLQEMTATTGAAIPGQPRDPSTAGAMDIKTFLQAKRPSNDTQFAAAVAYYYAFEAPVAERKPEVVSDDLQDAARLSGRPRLRSPVDILHNTLKAGYLDKGQGRGAFKINTVGENLVAMAMPSSSVGGASGKKGAPVRRAKKPKPATRKTPRPKKPNSGK
jgi:hypothetical protein